jgi:hypothetical protein
MVSIDLTSMTTFSTADQFLISIASDTFDFLPPDLKRVRQQQLFMWTQQAIQEARKTLRRPGDDPSGLLPLRPRSEASKRLYDRPKFRGRICSGSNRYRVLCA